MDEDFIGKRSAENTVKTISMINASCEGQSSDVVADAILRFALDSRLRRHGEGKLAGLQKVLANVLENRGEIYQRGVFVTADRG